MPMPNFHAARIAPPEDFDQRSFRTIHRMTKGGKPFSLIIGRRPGAKSTSLQAMRFPKQHWTPAQARATAKRAKALLFEPARKDNPMRRRRRNPTDKKAMVEWATTGIKLIAAVAGLWWLINQSKKKDEALELEKQAAAAKAAAAADPTKALLTTGASSLLAKTGLVPAGK